MPIRIFPGVYTTIKDESFYIMPLPTTIAFLPFFSRKGPDNQMILVGGQPGASALGFIRNELFDMFGMPDKAKYGEGLYVAAMWTSVGGSLYAMRVLPEDATFANLAIVVDPTVPEVRLERLPNINSIQELETRIQDPNIAAIFYGIGRGEYYNNIGIRLTSLANVENGYCIDIYEKDVSGDWVISETFDITFHDYVDLSGEQMKADHVLERYSNTIRCLINDEAMQQAISIIGPFDSLFNEIQTMDEGSDGSGLYDSMGRLNWGSDVPKQLLIQAYTGLIDDSVVDTEFIYFNIVLDAGYPTDVKEAIRQLCEDLRGDCVGIMDNGDSASASDALNKRTVGETSTFNSFYVALYECYSKIFDPYNGRDIWITPVYHMARIIPETDMNYDFWYPPAGLNRGMVYAKQLRYDLKGGYKDQFKLNQLNPIMHFRQGYVVWGQWTTYRKPSALQSLHIVRLVLWLKRVLEDNLRWFIWELNTPETRHAIQKSVSEILADIKQRGALEDFSVSVVSTEYDKKRGVVKVIVRIKPVRAIEIIELTLVVQ